MTEFRYLHGAVYIFENAKAQRVKVGMTINNVVDRLAHVNDMWLGRKVTCQVCGGRLVNIGGHVPQHGGSGRGCPGGNALPLERDMALAESHLQNMTNLLSELSGSEKGSVTRRIRTLAKRIDKEAPFGEVFCCSVSEATEAVETALRQLGLLDSAKKGTHL